ncbi:TIR domain-containing adapter molecule 1 [Brienomyrus brachyistius]|uniref:TIR domain-containing adapter molecule 1 n=1 Tax=Brienomyrus brachyistius TaxID=42636 RepID=UPI0020B29E2B|nr:TIR domain-containing adapter molecule 1 [Brienomyrus brachyistius]
MAERGERSDTEKDSEKRTESITGTSLKDAFKVLSDASQEKLQSLTLKRSSRVAEVLVQAMSLIKLRKGQDALNKLAALGSSGVAKYLAEQVTACRGQLEDFRIEEQAELEARTDTVGELAMIFQVLAEERLCSESLRDRAYRVALGACRSMNSNEEGRENRQLEQLMEEATMICGPEFVSREDGQFSCGKTLQSCSPIKSTQRGQDKKTSAIPIQGSQRGPLVPTVEHSSPTSLRSSSSNETSFPSHLEVSASPTAAFDSNRMSQAMQDLRLTPSHTEDVSPNQSLPLSKVVTRNNPAEECIKQTPILCSPYHRKVCDFVEVTEKSENNGTMTSRITNAKSTFNGGSSSKKPTEALLSLTTAITGNNKPGSATENVTNISRSTLPPVNSRVPEEQKEDKVEDEAQFFSFVILHAPEDTEMAERLQEKLEDLGIGEGSTFSQNFLVPGRTKLRCIEDAIDNSAFSILLLSRNFNNQLQEIQTNAALMNSIENMHKYNSVIPLFPSKNRLPTENMPKCLKIFVALEESSRSFDRMARKAMAPERIKKQKELWSQDQHIRLQQKKTLRLKEEIKRSKVLVNQGMEISQLEKEQRQLYMKRQQQNPTLQYYDTPGAISKPPQHLIDTDRQPSILISNAKYIMIGDNSQMTVDMSSDTDHVPMDMEE